MIADMCGRFAITLPTDAMAQLFSAVPANDLPDVPNYNVCPTDAVHVVSVQDGQRRLGAMRWGFIPQWYKKPNDGPLLINARGETIAEKPAFRAACRARRAVIVKHAHHSFDVDHPGKDSYRHRAAGAREVLLASRNRFALMHEMRGIKSPCFHTHQARACALRPLP